jgi:hypothetical protein
LVSLSQLYFSTALYSFAAKVRSEQVLGTLEAMLVSPTPTSVVIFSSTAWDFTWGALRLVVYLLVAVFVFGVKLNVTSPIALVLGVGLTLLSSAGIGMLSASFILYFKRGDPINFLLSAGTTFFGNVIFPGEGSAAGSPVGVGMAPDELVAQGGSRGLVERRLARRRRRPDRPIDDPDRDPRAPRSAGCPHRHPQGQA